MIVLIKSACVQQVLTQLKDKALIRAGLTEADVLHEIERRTDARRRKEWDIGDQIRSELTKRGIALMDEGKETVWRPCVPPMEEEPSIPVQQGLEGSLAETVQPPPSTNEEGKAN